MHRNIERKVPNNNNPLRGNFGSEKFGAGNPFKNSIFQ